MRSTTGFWQEHKGLVFFIGCMLVFRSAVADWNFVPSSSMNPTLVAGDRVLVNKLAYSLRVPFTLLEVSRWSAPRPGDVVTFDSPADGLNLIKRVVAVEGDTVSMVSNQLFINGQPQPRVLIERGRAIPTEHGLLMADVWLEVLGERSHQVASMPAINHLTDFDAVQIPPGKVMVMGDSRDNSHDSRFLGLIDVGRITGRAERVVMSHDMMRAYLPRDGRWWLPMDSTL